MSKIQFNRGFLRFLQYNRKFQECCFLLKVRADLQKKEPLHEFWQQREQRFLAWDYIPQTRSSLEYDIERICTICDLEYNRNNILLIFTCAHYGVWRTTRWLLKLLKDNNDKEEYDISLTTAFMVIRYLASLLSQRDGLSSVDHVTYGYVERVTAWLSVNGWGEFHMEKPHPSADNKEQLKFQRDICDALPLQIRALVEQINNSHKDNGRARRDRECKRNYFFWRWRRLGVKLLDIAEKWDEIENNEDPTQEVVVSIALGKYVKECGPLFNDIPTLHYYKKLTQHFDKRTAAENILEQAYRNFAVEKTIMLPIQEEIKIT